MHRYYRLVDTSEFNPARINQIIDLGGVHYQTITMDTCTIRFFVINFDDDDAIMIKLSLDVTLEELNENDVNRLKVSGYIK